MTSIQVYEYYDGYPHLWEEDEVKRARVQYIIVGEIDNNNLLTICYTGKFNHIANIGKTTHIKSWKKECISPEIALKYIQNSIHNKDKTIDDIEKEIEYIKQNKEEIDIKKFPKYGDSCSITITEYNISFYWNKYQSYSEKYINELEKKIEMLKVINIFMNELKLLLHK